MRRLALLGAQVLRGRETEPEVSEALRRLRAIPGYEPATRDVTDLPWLEGQEIDPDYRSAEVLAWVRRDLE